MQPDSAGRGEVRRPASKKMFKIIALGVAIVVVFMAGIGVGNGTIGLTPAANTANKNLPEDLNYSSVEQLYDLLKANYDGTLDEQKLIDGLKTGLVDAAGDQYTQYFNAADAQKFNAELSGSFTGIGAELGENKEGNLIIVSPMDGFPASKAGLRPQDIIVSIDGKTTTDMTTAEAVTHIRGPKDTKVTLRVLRNKSQDLSFTITRAEIKIPSVEWEVSDGIGYLKIVQFNEDTTMLARRAADEFKSKNVHGVILDVRDNPGGLLTAAVEVSSLWLPSGKTVLQEKRGGVVAQTYPAVGGATLQGVPTVVLTNAGSASASEIVAGALRDHNAAVLYGEKTYGKGSVQTINDKLPGGAEVKITIARWYRPNGQNIDKKGIKPDKEIKLSEEDYKQDRDPQKDAAIQYLHSRQ